MRHTLEASGQQRKRKLAETTDDSEEDRRIKQRAYNKELARKFRKKYPWLGSFYSARRRCSKKKDEKYYLYGGRGIKFMMKKEEVKFIWFRDRADLMDKPTIDRIDNDGNYELSNCRFLEHRLNTGRTNREKTHCKNGHLFSEENTYKKGRERVCRICSNIRRNFRRRNWRTYYK